MELQTNFSFIKSVANFTNCYYTIYYMTKINKILPFLFDKFLSDKTRTKTEKIILNVALLSFFIHLAFIYLLKLNIIKRETAV